LVHSFIEETLAQVVFGCKDLFPKILDVLLKSILLDRLGTLNVSVHNSRTQNKCHDPHIACRMKMGITWLTLFGRARCILLM
jgi:hypothetical protein